jgi:hypothetical protein
MHLPLMKKAGVLQVLSHPAATTAATIAGAVAPIIDAKKKEAAGVGPIADLASKTVGVLAHPAASTAATVGAVAAPFVAQSISDKKQEAKKAGFPKLSFIGAITGFMAKPAVAAGLNVMGAASMASSLMGGNNNNAANPMPARRPGREGANATPSGAFGGQGEGQTVTAGLITPQQTIPSELQVMENQPPPIGPTGPMGAGSNSASPPISMGKSKASPGAPRAFKASSWLDSPRLKRNLELGSQAAVIGSAAIPAYQIWHEMQREKNDQAANAAVTSTPVRPIFSEDQRRVRVASVLPLQKPPIRDRLGMGVRDFAEGAINELDNQSEKALTPSNNLDPLKTRTPNLLHLI